VAFYRQWLLVLLALVLSGEQLSAASAKEQSDYAAAVAAFQDEMWSRAETELAQFIQKYPKSTNAPEAVLLRSQAEFKQGKLADAIALLGDASHLAKAGTLADQYIYWIGEAQFQNADLTNAAETFISLAQNFPDSSLRLRAVIEAAAAYARLGGWRRHDALLEDTNGVFRQAAQLDPGNPLIVDGRLSLENSKYQQRDFPGVAAVYELLTNQWQMLDQGQQCQAVYLYCLAKMEQGDFASALAAATNLVQIAGSTTNQAWLATGWASQGAALKQMDRLPDAIQAWQHNLTNAPVTQEREAILKIAELEIVQGQLTNAEEALTNFLAQFPETISADIALLTAGELHLKDYAAQPEATNQLSAAQDCFDQFLRVFTNSPLVGKAYLDRGWCESLANDTTNRLADFENAAQRLPPSEDLAVARFKTGDALFAQKDFTNALENYGAVLDDFTNFPAVAKALGDRALYQILRSNLQLTNYDGASNALAQILKQYPASDLAPNSKLLYGEGLMDARQPAAAREQFQNFETQFPDTPLRPQVEFAIARAYELEQNWPAAIAGYQGWLDHFPTNQSRSQTIYALARANFQAGNETNAFELFANFVAQFPTNELAPQAQWWVADSFYNTGDFVNAEKNYELVYQNFQNFPTNDLAYPARMMAGRAAVARQDYKGAINNYFIKLEEDTNCPVDLWVQAAFAHGNALMQMDSAETNTLANFSAATNVFARIIQLYPTNEPGARAWGKIGECEFQLANYDAATNAYAQVFSTNSPASAAAGVSLRSEAQIGFGIALEKMAALATGADQTNLLQMALDNYLNVFYTWTRKNLRDGEVADEFWVKKAGLQALPLIEAFGTGSPTNFIGTMESLFPQAKDALEKKKATLTPTTK
jgi:TolA-binding protein